MDIATFIATVIVVTASGALAPGPLFFMNITQGAKSGAKGGLAFSVGHTVFELSLVLVLAFTVQAFVDEPWIRLVVGFVGGVALLVFGFLQIRGARVSKAAVAPTREVRSRNALLLGTLFTGLNPYFLIWWLTVGLTLIVNALELASFVGVVVMYVSHVWMDYAWLTGTAYLAKKGTSLVGSQGYRVLMMMFGVILVFFGLYFLVPALLAAF